MYSQIKKLEEQERIEFWIVTAFISAAFLLSLVDSMQAPKFPEHAQLMQSFGRSIFAVLFSHVIVYTCYLFLVFYVSPEFKKSQKIPNNALVIFGLIASCALFHIVNIYLAALLAIKLLLIFFNRNRENKENALYFESALLLASWLLILTFLNTILSNVYIVLYEYYAISASMMVYLYSMYHILPGLMSKKYRAVRYAGKMIFTALLSGLAVFIVLALIYGGNDLFGQHNFGFNQQLFFGGIMGPALFGLDIVTKFTVAGLTILTQILITAPISWSIYRKRQEKKIEEITTLKTELGKSDANLNLLKSQINPHFLFNALNTLYGTALQENAERTGEGIQKLGDMMRFMLQENMQDKILLSRDVEYLKNYILLQKLRTSISDKVDIQDLIEDQDNNLQITPMLLIPFVENAFKHGISLISPSHIKISLQTKDDTLYFDVYNSIHIKPADDPEKGQSGIGLDNVKQRLQLLYPGRHDLVIRENANDFFVHLTLQLDKV